MCMDFIKGMGAGLIVGAFVGMTCVPDKKKGKRMMAKAMRTVGDIMDDISSVMGH